MKVVVCAKQTPSTTAVFSVDNGTVSWDDPGGKPNVVNPWDEYAIEEAIRLKENHGATDAIAISVGGESSQDVLKTCLAMGCTEAILVSDEAFTGSDSLGTARILAAAINKVEDVQVALFGRQAIDGDSGQTPVQTARKLGWTPLIAVSAIKEINEGSITVERLTDDGKVTVTAPLPVVIGTVKELNEPRYPSLKGIMKAKKKPLEEKSLADLGLDASEVGAAAAGIKLLGCNYPPQKEPGRIIEGETPAEKVAALVTALREEAKVI